MSDLGWILAAAAALLCFSWYELRARKTREAKYQQSVEYIRRRNEYEEREGRILDPNNQITDEQRVTQMRELRREWRAGS